MNNSISLLSLMLVLLPLTIVLGTAAGIYLRERKPAWHRPFLLLYFGFLGGLLSVMILGLSAPGFVGEVTAWVTKNSGQIGTLKIVVAILGCLCITIGMFTVFSAKFLPKLLDPPFIKWLTSGGLEPSRRNRTMGAMGNIFMGAYLTLYGIGHPFLGLVAGALGLPFLIDIGKTGLREQKRQL